MSPIDVLAMMGGAVLLLSLAAVIVIYNGLVSLRNDCDRAWSNIDVLLKQRYNELPNLVEVCRGYMRHEQETLTRVTEARRLGLTSKGPSDAGPLEEKMIQAIDRLFAVAEDYPDLKANVQFLALASRITGIENEIADRREYFNDCVNNFNTRIEQLPDAIVAGWLGYRRRPLLRIPAVERDVPELKAA
jgi:LemA protein